MGAVTSRLSRSPRELLEEILLVDDRSSDQHLGPGLDERVSGLEVPVRVVRMKERAGLVKARSVSGVDG